MRRSDASKAYLNWRHTCLCTRWSWIGRRGPFSRLRNRRAAPPDISTPPPFLRSPCYPRRRLARCNRSLRTAIFHPRHCYFWKNRKEEIFFRNSNTSPRFNSRYVWRNAWRIDWTSKQFQPGGWLGLEKEEEDETKRDGESRSGYEFSRERKKGAFMYIYMYANFQNRTLPLSIYN